MSEPDFQRIALLIGKREPSILSDYLDQVANRALLGYRQHLQWGGKQGESLYTHVLNGILVLETMRPPLELTDKEARVLFTAFTIHDINKTVESQASFSKLASKEKLSREIERLGLDRFFPEWSDYLEDLTSLVRGHSGHAHVGGERWVVKRTDEYKLGLERVNALLHLMRAADIIDLSHSLEERDRKSDFIGHLNTYLSDSGLSRQFEWVTHRLTANRGLFTNVIHNAVAAELYERYAFLPLLYYPDGIAYLVERGQNPDLNAEFTGKIAARAAGAISQITFGKFSDFISSTGQGIKVDPKCLELGVPFHGELGILRAVYNLVQRRNLDPEALEENVRQRALRTFEKIQKEQPQAAAKVQTALKNSDYKLVSRNAEQLRLAELARAYYIFLLTHFKKQIPDPWQHIYQLLGLPEDAWGFYEYFDPRYDRAYILAQDISLGEEAFYHKIEADGQKIVSSEEAIEDPKTPLIQGYLERYLTFSTATHTLVGFGDHLSHYINTQHKQCVYCSDPFPTDKWMTGDVRSDITVQVFSNRLRGGPGEPKKFVCGICQLQFLLEKLNYPEVRNEKTLYLHLFPYSFLTRPFIEGLRTTINLITSEGVLVNALNMDAPTAIREYIETKTVTPNFRARTQNNRPQPYGLYLSRYSETTGNLIIFPINPAGQNDTDRFLFALWNALVLQRHFGVKVLMSAAAVPPLGKEDFDDIYIDNIPLAVQGLLPENNYAHFRDKTDQPGSLQALWDAVGCLFNLRHLTFTSQDHTSRLVRSLYTHPLSIFHETDRLLIAKTRGESGGLITWLTQQAFPSVESLFFYRGGKTMLQLSSELKKLAQVAWQNGLRGRTLERSSLLFPLSEVLEKMTQAGGALDHETLKAAAAQDIFDHLWRIANDKYKPGRRKRQACTEFVDGWFENVLKGLYGGNVRKMLADDKLLKSAFLFYVRDQIPHKAGQDETGELIDEPEVEGDEPIDEYASNR